MTTAATDALASRRWRTPERTRDGLRLAACAGLLVFVVGLFVAPGRAWTGHLLGFAFITSLALAGPVLLAFLTLAGARWSVALQRVPEAMGAALPAAGCLGLVLLFGRHELYEWSHPAVVALDPVLQLKAAYLDDTGFALRLVAIFVLWILFARRLVGLSRRFAATGDPAVARARVRWSAAFVAVVAVTFSVASIDWLMSLEPHWFSTLFPLLRFAGLASAGTAAAALLVLALERQGALRGVLRDEHLHDIGKLLFALTLLWAYLWYCQYMLIWYTDIPEETSHYLARRQGPWWLLVQTSLVLGWGVPFVALMARRTCRSRKVVGRVAAVVLAGHALDLLVQIGPPLMGPEPVLGLWELGPLAGATALFFERVLGALERVEPVPTDHPHLVDSLSYHTP